MTAPALDFDDPTDLADAERGLVGRLEPCVIRDGEGRTVWDVSVFGFLDADCPETAHPALWRHCRLTRLHGLYEVAEGVYQVRGMDLSNMTIIEGETGVLVIDPLLCRETSAAAAPSTGSTAGTGRCARSSTATATPTISAACAACCRTTRRPPACRSSRLWASWSY